MLDLKLPFLFRWKMLKGFAEMLVKVDEKKTGYCQLARRLKQNTRT
ncbi:MAG: hypothetical protein WCR72_09575 [Bacteroidota bacterium]